ncbi:putative amidoligase enzyme-domain-containing protein [Bisporella sp. PMI_857]|nr:putative amidoligase enzyme-domain-containing protein [Bisporella sp. PMI_857]
MPPRTTLSFGVEFEMNFASIGKDENDPDPNNPIPIVRRSGKYEGSSNARECRQEMKNHIAQTLENNDIHALVDFTEQRTDSKNFAKGVTTPWIVKYDSTIHSMNRREEYKWESIEIVSPPLWFMEDSIEQVQRVCKIVSTNYRTWVNDTCGFHVHIGDGLSGFSLETLQKLMGFLFTFETVIEAIHPTIRRTNFWCQGLWESTKLSRPDGQRIEVIQKHNACSTKRRIHTRIDGLKRIFATTTRDDLIKLVRCDDGRRHAYNIQNLRDFFPTLEDYITAGMTKRTIEFRMHEAVPLVDSDRMIRWVRVCAGFVFYARDKPLDEVKSLLFERIGKPNTLPYVLLLINCKPEAIYYDFRAKQGLVNKPQGRFRDEADVLSEDESSDEWPSF